MSKGRYRVWQFLHPDLDADKLRDNSAASAGFQLLPTGGAATIEERAAVRQALLLLLSTRLGERVMRPNYGCDLQRLLFSPNDETTAGLAIYYVRQAIERWEPRVEILKLDAGANPERPYQLDIWLDYRLRSGRQSGLIPSFSAGAQMGAQSGAAQSPPDAIAFAINLAGE